MILGHVKCGWGHMFVQTGEILFTTGQCGADSMLLETECCLHRK